MLSPMFTVQGSPISNEGGGQGARDDDDGLLAPMPTYAPGVIPGGVSQPAVQPLPEQAPDSDRKLILSLVLTLAVVAIFAVFRFRIAGKN